MIKRLIEEVREAINADLPIVAFSAALTLPDMCANVAFPEIKGRGIRYKKWLQEYYEPYYE